jgi:DNA-binding MarR family transcriptional regulator
MGSSRWSSDAACGAKRRRVARPAEQFDTLTILDPSTDLLDAARAAARLSKQLELALADVDLTLAQYRALAFLARGNVAPSVLAGRLAVSRPTITALVDGLATRGFVERHPDADDRRRVEHVLTPAGHDALDQADAAIAARLELLLGHLPARDGERALQGLRAWSTAIDAHLAGLA